MAQNERKWVFGTSLKESVFDISKLTHFQLFQIKQDLNFYLKENRQYYEKRRQIRIEAKFRAAIYQKYKHMCVHCEQSLHNEEPIELHDIIPQKLQGK